MILQGTRQLPSTLRTVAAGSWWLALLGIGLALALAVLPFGQALILVVVPVVGLLVLTDPIWALYGLVLSVSLQEVVLLPGGLTSTQALFVLAASAWGMQVLAYPTRYLVFGRLAWGLAVLLWTFLLAAITTPYSQLEGLKETLRWATVALTYLLALNSLHVHRVNGWRRRASGLVICLLLAPGANAALGLWQFATASGPPSFAIADGDFVRAYGTIGQPNSFAGYMNMAWPLALALAGGAWMSMYPRLHIRADTTSAPHPTAQSGATLRTSLFFSGLAALLMAAVGASFSRGGWLGALTGGGALLLAVITFLHGSQRTLAWRWVGGLAASGVVLLALGGGGMLPGAVARRIDSITRNLRLFDVRTVKITSDNFAVVERMAHLQAGWDMFRQHPLTGVGPGNYTLAYEGQNGWQTFPFSIHPWYRSRGHTHNYYLNLAAEVGLAGLLAYLFLLGLLVKQAHVALRVAEGWFWRSVAAGGGGVIAAVAMHNLFENLHVLNMGVQLGALWGLLTAIEYNMRSVPASSDKATQRQGNEW